MGTTTGITWTDHTFNPWIGCTKVSQGCKLCYAETQNRRYNWTAGWGPGAPRKRTSAANWKKPLEWARQAVKDGVTRRVFCASLADVFDMEIDEQWRIDLWDLMDETADIGGLEWLILTKRPENIAKMFPSIWRKKPPRFIRLGVTCEDQDNGEARLRHLFDAWEGKTFVSAEPLLGPLDLVKIVRDYRARQMILHHCGIDWVIVGGESGAGCRPMKLEWARNVREQCGDSGVPFFFKQLGGFPDKRHDPAEWPEDLRVQEFPTEETA